MQSLVARRLIQILALCILSASAAYADTNSPDLKDLAGLYWLDHKSALHPYSPGDEYDVTDVLEIVPYTEKSAYIRAKLYFSNGHSCAFWGIADAEGEKLTYRGPTEHNCIMDVVPTEKSISLIDRTGGCRLMTCGARGEYGASFTRSKKRAITYMAKLKNSVQYQEAIREYRSKPK